MVKTPWRVGPLARYDVLDEDWERLTLGAFYGLPDDAIRVLLNSELRREEGTWSDVRSYIWVQGAVLGHATRSIVSTGTCYA